MKVEIGENNALLVFLEKEDIAALGLRRESGEYEIPSPEVLREICCQAVQLSGFRAHPRRSEKIELLPFDDGSMLICFYFSTGKVRYKVRVRRKSDMHIYEIGSPAAFAAWLDSLEGCEELPAAVFERDGCFRLLVQTHCRRLEQLVLEFARRVTCPLAESQTREYWRQLY